jgi:hypothetical protein
MVPTAKDQHIDAFKFSFSVNKIQSTKLGKQIHK